MIPMLPPLFQSHVPAMQPGSTGRMEVLGTRDEARWLQVLQASGGYDFCHLPQYHRVAEGQGEGTAHLFVWQEDGHTIALPLLVRPVDMPQREPWMDATSVYGYGGPVVSPGEISRAVVDNFQGALHQAFRELRIVCAFSRLHPLLPQHHLLDGLGEFQLRGQTVSIDLTLPEEVQWAGYHKKCRQEIRKLQDAGFVGIHDPELRYLPEFVQTYHETMGRVSAHSAYYFDLAYFQSLAREMGPALHLFVVLHGDEVAAASLATLSGGIMQDFLGGSRNAYLKMSPDRLSVDTERRYAREMGAHVLHLGGGVGSLEDTVFKYKTRFSGRRHTFSTWQGLFLPEVYDSLCSERARLNAELDLSATNPGYFPAYRCPTVAK